MPSVSFSETGGPLPPAPPLRPNDWTRAKIERMESKSHMTRSTLCLPALLLSSLAVFAQTSAPASSPAPAASVSTPAPGVATDVGPQVKEFQKIEDTWSTAINSRDQYSLEL